MVNFARAVESVRQELDAEGAVLIGHSMGGAVVRQYALMYPDRVTGLVSVDGLILIPGPETGAAPVPASMSGEEGSAAREAMVNSMFSNSTTNELRDKIRNMMLNTAVVTADGAMQATWDTSHWTAEPVDVPVLGIYADGSQLSANRKGMSQIYPMIEYHEIPETGHFLMMEKPSAFNHILENFLASLHW
jgi:pimeloyl-ACP methyl ester carboxylesterase